MAEKRNPVAHTTSNMQLMRSSKLFFFFFAETFRLFVPNSLKTSVLFLFSDISLRLKKKHYNLIELIFFGHLKKFVNGGKSSLEDAICLSSYRKPLVDSHRTATSAVHTEAHTSSGTTFWVSANARASMLSWWRKPLITGVIKVFWWWTETVSQKFSNGLSKYNGGTCCITTNKIH